MTRSKLAPLVALTAVALTVACVEHDDDELALDRARNAVLHERSDWARVYFAEDFESHPERFESLRDGAYAWLSGYQRSRAEARTLLKRYLEYRPDDQRALQIYIGELLVNRDIDEGRRRAEKLDDSAHSNLLRARLFDDEPRVADDFVTQAIETDPENGAAWALGATISEKLGDDLKATERALRAFELRPFDYQNVYLLGRLYRRSGDLERSTWALELHQSLAELASDGTRPQLSPAEELHLLEELESALPSAGCEYRRRLVTAHFANRSLAAAEDLARDLIDTCGATVPELLALAAHADDRGRRSFSLEILGRVEAMDPGNVAVTIATAVAAVDDGRFDDARRIIQAGKTRDPWVAYYSYLEGFIAQTQDDPFSAVDAFEAALKLAPWQADWRIQLVETYLSLDEIDRARKVVSEAPEQPPEWVAYCQRHRSVLGG